jgi:hypothetical protein
MVSMYMKNVKIRGRMCHVHEFEDTVVLDSEMEKVWKLNKLVCNPAQCHNISKYLFT